MHTYTHYILKSEICPGPIEVTWEEIFHEMLQSHPVRVFNRTHDAQWHFNCHPRYFEGKLSVGSKKTEICIFLYEALGLHKAPTILQIDRGLWEVPRCFVHTYITYIWHILVSFPYRYDGCFMKPLYRGGFTKPLGVCKAHI